MKGFSGANGRITYIVGDKPYFLGKCKFLCILFFVYIAVMLWSTKKHNGQYPKYCPDTRYGILTRERESCGMEHFSDSPGIREVPLPEDALHI